MEGVEDESSHEVAEHGVSEGVAWECQGVWVEEVYVRFEEGHNPAVNGVCLLVGGGLDPWLVFVQGVVEGEVMVCQLDGIIVRLARALLRVVVAEEGVIEGRVVGVGDEGPV